MKQNKIPRNEYIRKPVGKTNPYKEDTIYTDMGQWKYPGQVTKIPSGDITMQGVPYPVYGEDNLGNSQMMYPGMDYTFPGQYVTEYPQMQIGGLLKKGLTAAKKVVKNTYNVNPFALKENPEMYLYRARPVGQNPNMNIAAKLRAKEAAGEPLTPIQRNIMNNSKYKEYSPALYAREKYYGQWFEKDPSRLDWYIDPGKRNFADDDVIEILRTKLPKSEAAKLNVSQFDDAKILSASPKTEFILPKDMVNTAETFPIGSWQELIQQDKTFNTPHWLRGYSKKAYGGGLLNKTLTCPSCGWSWKAVDGGKDIATCHKCGGTAKLAYGGDPSLPNIEDHYPFGGQNSKTGTHFEEGGWLDKYQEAGQLRAASSTGATPVSTQAPINPTNATNLDWVAEKWNNRDQGPSDWNFTMMDKSGSYVDSGIDPFTAFLSAPQQVIKTVSTTLPKAVKAVGEKFKSLKGLPKGAKAVENFKKVMGNDLDIDKVISLSQHEKDIALNRENLIKAAISGNQEEFTKAQNTMNHLMARLADQTKNTGDIGGKLGTAKDVARMKDLKVYGLKTEFLPTKYQRKLDTDLIKYNNEYGTSFNVRNPNPTEADKFTGYTDVPGFNQELQQLKTKIEYGKKPLLKDIIEEQQVLESTRGMKDIDTPYGKLSPKNNPSPNATLNHYLRYPELLNSNPSDLKKLMLAIAKLDKKAQPGPIFNKMFPESMRTAIYNNERFRLEGKMLTEMPDMPFTEHPSVKSLKKMFEGFEGDPRVQKKIQQMIDKTSHAKLEFKNPKQYTGKEAFSELHPNKYGGQQRGWLDELDELDEEYRRGGQRRRRGTSKNIQSSINDVFRRNYDVFGPAGKSRFNPRARYEEGGDLPEAQLGALLKKGAKAALKTVKPAITKSETSLSAFKEREKALKEIAEKASLERQKTNIAKYNLGQKQKSLKSYKQETPNAFLSGKKTYPTETSVQQKTIEEIPYVRPEVSSTEMSVYTRPDFYESMGVPNPNKNRLANSVLKDAEGNIQLLSNEDWVNSIKTGKSNIINYLENPTYANVVEHNQKVANRLKLNQILPIQKEKGLSLYESRLAKIKEPITLDDPRALEKDILFNKSNVGAQYTRDLEGKGSITMPRVFPKEKTIRDTEHEILHHIYPNLGEGYPSFTPLESLKAKSVFKSPAELRVIEEANDVPLWYLDDVDELVPNTFDLAKDLGIQKFQKYPGKESFKSMLENYKGNKPFIKDALKLNNSRDYKRAWDMMTGVRLGLVPGAIGAGYALQEQKMGGWLDKAQKGINHSESTFVRKPIVNIKKPNRQPTADDLAWYSMMAAQERQPDVLQQKQAQGKGSKAWDIMMNPFTASGHLYQHGSIPDNFTEGPTSPLDIAPQFVNPAFYAEALYNVGKVAVNPQTYKDMAKTAQGLGMKAMGKEGPEGWQEAGFNTLGNALDVAFALPGLKMAKKAKSNIIKYIDKAGKGVKKEIGKSMRNYNPRSASPPTNFKTGGWLDKYNNF